MNQITTKVDSDDKRMKLNKFKLKKNHHWHSSRRLVHIYIYIVEGHLWKAQWKKKPNDEGHSKLTMNS